jgi:hypothetical protein
VNDPVAIADFYGGRLVESCGAVDFEKEDAIGLVSSGACADLFTVEQRNRQVLRWLAKAARGAERLR